MDSTPDRRADQAAPTAHGHEQPSRGGAGTSRPSLPEADAVPLPYPSELLAGPRAARFRARRGARPRAAGGPATAIPPDSAAATTRSAARPPGSGAVTTGSAARPEVAAAVGTNHRSVETGATGNASFAGGNGRAIGPNRHHPWLVAVALVAITSEIAMAAGVLSARAGEPSTGRPPVAAATGQLSEKDARAIRDVLTRRAGALLRRDRAAFLADIDPRATTLHAREAALFNNIRNVPISAWEFHPGAALPMELAQSRRHGGQVWGGQVELRYRLAGFDHTLVAKQYLTFVRRGSRWLFASDDDFAARGQVTTHGLWDFGPVTVRSSPAGLVLAHPAEDHIAAEIDAMLRAAVVRVTAVWRDWPGKAVVMVGSGASEVQALIPGEREVADVAAITTTEVNRGGATVGERIVVNSVAFQALTPAARDVVIQHEVAHVATAAVTSEATPTWLAEGFAEYLAYRDRPVPPRTAAGQLTTEVRAGRVPDALPGEGEFVPGGPRVSAAYESAWLACRLIADRAGEDGLVRLYRIVSAGPGEPDASIDSGLRSVLGVTTEEFVVQWRRYVRAQLT